MAEPQVHDIEFQRKVLHLAAEDRIFWERYATLLTRDYFNGQPLKTAFDVITRLVNDFNKEVDKTEVLTALNAFFEQQGFEGPIAEASRDEVRAIFRSPITNAPFITDRFLDFIKRQKFHKALNDGIDIMNNGGDPEAAIRLLEEAAAVGCDSTNLGMSFADMRTLPQQYREQFSPDQLTQTGIPTLDAAHKGGYAPGEVHIIQGIPKSGKSTLACNIGAYNTVQGKAVFHATMELKELDVMTKYAARMTGLSYDEILIDENSQYDQRMAQHYDTQKLFFTKYWVQGTINAYGIRTWIAQIRARHHALTGEVLPVGLIVVDYDDLILPVSGSTVDTYNDAGTVYGDLFRLADYFKAPVLTLAQPTRSGNAWERANKGEMLYAYDLAHSARKAHAATSISSVNFAAGSEFGVYYLDMNRRGSSAVKIPMRRDLSRAFIAETVEGYTSENAP